MSAPATEAVSPLEAPSGSPLHRIAWHWRHNPKRELWLAWWTIVAFYQLFFLVFFVLTRTQPPPSPGWDVARVVQWFHHHHYGLLIGFGIMFLIGSLVWMLAILLDRNRVLPKWFGYLNLCNALTEIVVSPAWIFKTGVFAWNGLIAWWIDMVVFGLYTGVFIFLLRRMIQREGFGTGPLPDLAPTKETDPSALAETAQ